MKTSHFLKAILIVLITVSNAIAQEFTGEAIYKSKQKVDIKLDSTKMSSDMQAKMSAMLKKQFEKTHVLTFNKEASIYKEETALAAPQPASGMMVSVGGSGDSDILYKNTKTQRFVNQQDFLGKIFLIKDSLKINEWQLDSQSKHIGEYTCYKATMIKERPKRKIGPDADSEDKSETASTEKETYTVTAWYTPQIPVNHGPKKYYGLPGLILEVNDGKQTIICSKIVLNPDKEIIIKEPTKGKEVSQKEYDEIIEKKLNEMNERFKSRSGSRDGQTIEIRIGG